MASRSLAQCSRSLGQLRQTLQNAKSLLPESYYEISLKPIAQRSWISTQTPNKSPSLRQASTSSTAAKASPLQDPAPITRSPLATRRRGVGLASTETYVAYGIAKKLFEACSSQADYKIPQISQKGAEVPKTASGEDIGVGQGWWYEDLGLLPTFSSWSQVSFLHMYLLTVRFRAGSSPESFQMFSRHLFDHFSNHAEDRMDVMHGITSRAIRVKYLKDLFLQWRGVIAAYDEGLIKGDAVLGAAVWRNLYKGSYTDLQGRGEEIDWNKVAEVVLYMRKVLNELARIEEPELAHAVGGEKGIFKLSQGGDSLVQLESKGMREPFVA